MMELAKERRPKYSTILYFFSRYKRLYGTALVAIIITSVLESISVAAVFPLFSSILSDTQTQSGGILGVLNRVIELVPISNEIVASSVLLIGVFLLKGVFSAGRDIFLAYVDARVFYDVKRQVFAKVSDSEYLHYLDNKQGTILYTCLASPTAVYGILRSATRTVSAAFKAVAIIAVVLSIMPGETLVFISLGAVYYFGIHLLTKTVSFRWGEDRANARTEQSVILNEFLNGFPQILTFGVVDHWTGRFDNENKTDRRLLTKIQAMQAIPRPVLELFSLGLLLGLVAFFALTSPGNLGQNLASLGVFGVATIQLVPTLTSIGTTWMGIFAALPDAQRSHEVLTGSIPSRKGGTQRIEEFQESISFKNVSFAYPERPELFKDVSLEFQKGKMTAIVGASGAGKSTIINLILGLFEPTNGQITVDGALLNDLDPASWLSNIGFVSQQPFIYHASIESNILMGRTGYSKESIIEASKIANAHSFISELPKMYETEIGERGMKLSGGQQQRIAIARAVLASPEILIFDEATSSLDTLSEKLVQEAIESASSNRTVITIAHRLSTIRHADQIIVFDKGNVVEVGRHEELIELQGHYSKLAGAADSTADVAAGQPSL